MNQNDFHTDYAEELAGTPTPTKPINLPNLLEYVNQALDDWLTLEYPDGCKREDVVKAWKRIQDGGGTLSFVTSLRERVSKAIEQLEKKG